MRSEERQARKVLDKYGFKVVKAWQTTHMQYLTECGRKFTAPVSPSDSRWIANFERDVKRRAADRDLQNLLPADVARCTGLLNARFSLMDECEDCRRRIDPPWQRQVWMMAPADISAGCEYRIGVESAEQGRHAPLGVQQAAPRRVHEPG